MALIYFEGYLLLVSFIRIFKALLKKKPKPCYGGKGKQLPAETGKRERVTSSHASRSPFSRK